MGKEKNVDRSDDYSSEEEELFSYLTKVEKCKPPEPVRHSVHDNQNVSYDVEAEKNNKEEPGTNNSYSKLQVIEEVGKVKSVTGNEICIDEDEEENDNKEVPNTNNYCSEIVRSNEDVVSNVKPSSVEYSESIGQHVENNECLDSNIPLESKIEEMKEPSNKVEKMEEVSNKLNAEKVETSLQTSKDTVDVDIKQNSGSPGKRDRYYLINEKDWLTLCAKLDNAENVGNMERKTETCLEDSSEEMHLQDSSKSNSDEKKSPNGKGKSLFSAFKQCSPISKTLLKETDSNPTTSNTSPMKQTRKQIGKPTEQLVSQDEHKWSESNISKSTPNVEIVYISLDGGNIKYDINNSPVKVTGNTNPNDIRELNFCQQNSVNFTHNQKPVRVQTTVPNDIECIDLVNDDQDKYKTNFNFGNSNTVFNNPLSTDAPTGHGRQVRFVRIDNKLTRIYENVKHNETDAVADAYVQNRNVQYSQMKEEVNVAADDIDGNVNDNDSFNFNDSQLVAFPLNAFDAENINKDDSMSQLTPSKLDILNTSCNMDPLTPSKLQINSQSVLYHLSPNKRKWYSPSKSDLSSPYKLDITPTNNGGLNAKESYPNNDNSLQSRCSADMSEKGMEIDSPMILKVNKSDVQKNVNKSQIQNPWKTFKPVQQNTKGKNTSMSAYEDHASKDLVKPSQCSEHTKKKISELVCSVKIQESCSRLYDEQNVGKRRQLDPGNGRKIKNVKTGNRKNGNKMIEDTNVSKAVTDTKKEVEVRRNKTAKGNELCSKQIQTKVSEYYFYPNGDIKPKNDNESAVSCIDGNNQTRKKRKCKTRITSCHNDCNYKQVDFKDFENESQDVICKRKFCVDTKGEETFQHVVVNNTSNLKENQKNISRIKDDKMPIKKRKVTTYEINENSELIQDEQGEGVGVKKSCLTKDAKLVKSKSKNTSERENGTKEKETLDKAEVLNMNDRQEKIDFLENMFHVKLKEASVSSEGSNLLESSSKLNEDSTTCEMFINKFENSPDEKTSKRRKIGARVKNGTAVKRNKRKMGEVSATASINDNKQVSKLNKLDKSPQCRRNRNKNTEHIENPDQNVDDNRIHSDLNEHCSTGKETKPHTITKSPKGKCVRVKQKQDGQNLDKEFISDCNAKSKSKSQRQRTAHMEKKSDVLSTKGRSKAEEMSRDKSDNSLNAVASKNTRTRGKLKCLKNIKSGNDQTVNNVTDKESGGENVLVENETEKEHHSVAQKNEKENEGKVNKYSNNKKASAKTKNRKVVNDSNNKRAPGKPKSKKIVKCKNIELNSSSDMDGLHTNVKNEHRDSQTVVVESSGPALLNSNGKDTDSDDKKSGTIISILATFQPLQGEESQCDEVTETAEARNKDYSQDKISEMKVDKETHNVKKIRVLSKGSGKRMPKRKELIVTDMCKTKTDNIKVPKDLSSEEAHGEKVCSESDNKNNKTKSPKMVRTGKAKVNNSIEKGFAAKSLKPTKRPYTRRKLKCTSKGHGKESWKELLDDSAFNIDINDVTTEKHKPVNVRRMIRNILKTSQGKEKSDDEHHRHREKKEKSHREKKDESFKDHTSGSRSSSQILTLESDDAWMSDSSQSTSFPAFQFTAGSDSETDKQVSKVLKNDNNLENMGKLETDSNKNVTDMQHSAQNYIELHHSPVKVTNATCLESVSETKPTDSTEARLGTKGSPEIKKNVDKLIAILDKVSEKKVVKNLQFLDNASS